MLRINLLRNQLCPNLLNQTKGTSNATHKYISSAYDYLDFDQFLTKEEIEYRKRLRTFLENEVSPKIPYYYEKQEFPLDLFKLMISKFPGILGSAHQGYGSAGFSHNLALAVNLELSRIDLSFFGFVLVHGWGVVMKSIYNLGSEEQKQKYIPKLNNLELLGSFCLTEPEYGSDAYSIQTTATEDGDSYVIKGTKRWIGQGTIADLYIVWAKNLKTNQIEGYFVENFRKGITAKRIEGKLAMRITQNAEITFDNVRVPKENKLDKSKDFVSTVSKVFLDSRIAMAWACVGVSIGCYDKVIKYLNDRKQFGKKLTSFQLIQEKLGKIMGNIQASMWFCKRTSDMLEKKKATMGMAGMCKAWCTSRARETAGLAREIMGANGILLENYVIKAMADVEGLHTAEGTYEINMLLAGKELTGENALI
jgi:alkylation response protein AidB-like acyl-CoA dehydrogenase